MGKKREEGKNKGNKTRIMTNQDRKHGFQIKTDTMDAVTKGKLTKWTQEVMIKTKRITSKAIAAFEPPFFDKGVDALSSWFLSGL